MATATGEKPIKLLVYCPHGGGWHVGEWLRSAYYEGVWYGQGWRATIDHNIELRLTHWLPYPEEPPHETTDQHSPDLRVI